MAGDSMPSRGVATAFSLVATGQDRSSLRDHCVASTQHLSDFDVRL